MDGSRKYQNMSGNEVVGKPSLNQDYSRKGEALWECASQELDQKKKELGVP